MNMRTKVQRRPVKSSNYATLVACHGWALALTRLWGYFGGSEEGQIWTICCVTRTVLRGVFKTFEDNTT